MYEQQQAIHSHEAKPLPFENVNESVQNTQVIDVNQCTFSFKSKLMPHVELEQVSNKEKEKPLKLLLEK